MGYFANLHAMLQEQLAAAAASGFTPTVHIKSADDMELDWLCHCTTAKLEGFKPLTRKQFALAAQAAARSVSRLDQLTLVTDN